LRWPDFRGAAGSIFPITFCLVDDMFLALPVAPFELNVPEISPDHNHTLLPQGVAPG
jgi:hypothetical protein